MQQEDPSGKPKAVDMRELVRSYGGLVNRHRPWSNPNKSNNPKRRQGGSKARRILQRQQ